MRLGRYGSIVGVCLGLAATGAGIIWPIDRDIGGALFVIGIGVVVVSSIWFVVSRESSYARRWPAGRRVWWCEGGWWSKPARQRTTQQTEAEPLGHTHGLSPPGTSR